MFSTEKKLLSALCASVFALSAMADAKPVIEQPFATTGDLTADAYKANWSGNGTVKGLETAPTVTVGNPIAGATDKNVLSVEGKVQCAAVTTGPTLVDMMIQIAKPDEALEVLSDADVKLAVGVDSNCKLNVFCAPKSGTGNAWHVLDGTYTEGSWHRVSFRFDYENGTCQLSVDGNPQVSANGYLTSGKTGDSGSWYPLVGKATGLASVQIVGSTAIDEVVVKSGTLDETVPGFIAPAGADDIPQEWFVKQGISSTGVTASTPAPDASGMTLKAKYVTGISPFDDEKLAIKAMAPAADGLTLTVPAATPAGAFQNVIEVKNGDSVVETTAIAAGTTTVKVPAPAATTGAVKYTYQIKTVTK